MANITATLSDDFYLYLRQLRTVLPPEQLVTPREGQLWPRGDKNIYV